MEVLGPWIEHCRKEGTIFVLRGALLDPTCKIDGVLKVTAQNLSYSAYSAGYTPPSTEGVEKELLDLISQRQPPASPAPTILTATEYRGPYSKAPVSMNVRSREIKFLLGPNGSGKTTFGRAVVDGNVERGAITHDASIIPTMALQNPERCLFSGTVEKQLNKDRTLLSLCGLSEGHASRHPLSLSRAQQKLLSIASAMQLAVGLVVLDEPSLGLDATDYVWFGKLLKHFYELAVIVLTHDPILISVASQASLESVDMEVSA
jgi:energy-coupling factor transporter ATP-binding protein EcfA2